LQSYLKKFHIVLNPAASVFPVACRGVSERVDNIIIPYGSKILHSVLWRASITGDVAEGILMIARLWELILMQ